MNPDVVAAMKATGATWTVSSGAPIVWPNEAFDQSTHTDPFVYAEIEPLTAGIRTLGAVGQHWLRDDGFIRFHIMVPYGEGSDRAYTLADSLRTAFRIVNPATGCQTLAPTPAQITDGDNNGRWTACSISVPFYYDYEG